MPYLIAAYLKWRFFLTVELMQPSIIKRFPTRVLDFTWNHTTLNRLLKPLDKITLSWLLQQLDFKWHYITLNRLLKRLGHIILNWSLQPLDYKLQYTILNRLLKPLDHRPNHTELVIVVTRLHINKLFSAAIRSQHIELVIGTFISHHTKLRVIAIRADMTKLFSVTIRST